MVHIERDTMVIINACIKGTLHNWSLEYILIQTWKLLDSSIDVHISHTLHEGNQVVDLLANSGCDEICVDLFSLMHFIQRS